MIQTFEFEGGMTPAEATDTKERILDAVEDLVGECGCDGTSVRMITEAAGVNVAAVNYHFGSKEELLVAAAGRISTTMNEARVRMLRETEARHAPDGPPVAEITRALIEPAFVAMSQAGDRATARARFGAMICSAPSEALQERIHECFRQSSDLIWDHLCRAVPDVGEEEMTSRYRGALAVMINATADTRNANAMRTEAGRERLLDHLVTFVASGFAAPPSGPTETDTG
jgi:AcrR family transcriptional regulator